MTCESVACRSYFTNKSVRDVCALRDLWYLWAMCVRASMKAAKPLHIVLATNPNPTRARGYPLNINPKPDPKPDSISGPAGSGRVADLYCWLNSSSLYGSAQQQSLVYTWKSRDICIHSPAVSTPRAPRTSLLSWRRLPAEKFSLLQWGETVIVTAMFRHVTQSFRSYHTKHSIVLIPCAWITDAITGMRSIFMTSHGTKSA